MAEAERPDAPEPPVPDEEELEELDYIDPLKRDPDSEVLPGFDPIVPPVPPES
jgi:hypothetical protein